MSEQNNLRVLVLILQLETRECDANISNLKNLFADPYFTVYIILPDDNIDSNILENQITLKALSFAKEKYPDLPCLLIKDSSVSNLSILNIKSPMIGGDDKNVSHIRNNIEKALNSAPDADLYYLCKWQDACHKYADVKTYETPGSSLKWSMAPNSTQAIIYKTTTRDKIICDLENPKLAKANLNIILNKYITKGELWATVFVPNLIDYDINLATANKDYLKLNECTDPAASNTSNSSVNSPATWIWLIIIIVIIFIIAYIMMSMFKR